MNNYLCTILIELIFYKLTHVRIEDAFLDNIKCNNARRNHGEHDDNDSIPSNGFITFSINIFFVFKIKHSHTHKCSQTNKHRIDKKEIECPQEEKQMSRSNSVSCRT